MGLRVPRPLHHHEVTEQRREAVSDRTATCGEPPGRHWMSKTQSANDSRTEAVADSLHPYKRALFRE